MKVGTRFPSLSATGCLRCSNPHLVPLNRFCEILNRKRPLTPTSNSTESLGAWLGLSGAGQAAVSHVCLHVHGVLTFAVSFAPGTSALRVDFPLRDRCCRVQGREPSKPASAGGSGVPRSGCRETGRTPESAGAAPGSQLGSSPSVRRRSGRCHCRPIRLYSSGSSPGWVVGLPSLCMLGRPGQGARPRRGIYGTGGMSPGASSQCPQGRGRNVSVSQSTIPSRRGDSLAALLRNSWDQNRPCVPCESLTLVFVTGLGPQCAGEDGCERARACGPALAFPALRRACCAVSGVRFLLQAALQEGREASESLSGARAGVRPCCFSRMRALS